MNDLQQKQLTFLEDTIKFYGEDITRRSVTIHGVCNYNNNGKACAIGRHLSPELAVILDKYTTNTSGSGVSSDRIFNWLPTELKCLGQSFLIDMQRLHDVDINWELGNGKGLSETGTRYVEYIKTSIKNNRYC